MSVHKRSPVAGAGGGDEQCMNHKSPFVAFCATDDYPLCVGCLQSGMHNTHTIEPVDLAAASATSSFSQILTSIKDVADPIRTRWEKTASFLSDLVCMELQRRQEIEHVFDDILFKAVAARRQELLSSLELQADQQRNQLR